MLLDVSNMPLWHTHLLRFEPLGIGQGRLEPGDRHTANLYTQMQGMLSTANQAAHQRREQEVWGIANH